MTVTITEALAELKTIRKRIDKKNSFIVEHLVRQEKFKDPLQDSGGQRSAIARERQAIADLENRFVAIRLAIAQANEREVLTVQGESATIAWWLIWRREIAPTRQSQLRQMQQGIHHVRRQAQERGSVVSAAGDAVRPDDVLVNIDEKKLAEDVEKLETILGDLDGQLSLKNATVMIEI